MIKFVETIKKRKAAYDAHMAKQAHIQAQEAAKSQLAEQTQLAEQAEQAEQAEPADSSPSLVAAVAEEFYRIYLGPKLKENADNASKALRQYFSEPVRPHSAHIIAEMMTKLMTMEQDTLTLALSHALDNVGYKLNAEGRLRESDLKRQCEQLTNQMKSLEKELGKVSALYDRTHLKLVQTEYKSSRLNDELCELKRHHELTCVELGKALVGKVRVQADFDSCCAELDRVGRLKTGADMECGEPAVDNLQRVVAEEPISAGELLQWDKLTPAVNPAKPITDTDLAPGGEVFFHMPKSVKFKPNPSWGGKVDGSNEVAGE